MVEPGIARIPCLVGVRGILERKALIDVHAHLSRSHHIPEACPNVTIYPRDHRESSERKKTSLPTALTFPLDRHFR